MKRREGKGKDVLRYMRKGQIKYKKSSQKVTRINGGFMNQYLENSAKNGAKRGWVVTWWWSNNSSCGGCCIQANRCKI